MKKLLFVVLGITLSAQLIAQAPGGGRPGGGQRPGGGNFERPTGPVVFGRVVDDTDVPVPYASATLHSVGDSALVAGTATGENGFFKIEAKPGNYILKIAFLSFDTHYQNIELGNEPVRVGRVALKSSAVALNEAVITADRTQMELKLDKRVFNVGKDLSNTGADASEVLDNIPSVTVDVDGNVQLRGSENVRILIDGKPSGLTGLSAQDALRQLPADMVERVEVITNPSARYDAEGEVGIINIILKKEKKKGVNGSINLRAGYPANYGGSINLNVRRKKVNFFGSYGLNYRERPGSGLTNSVFTYADTSFSYNSNEEHSRNGSSQNVRGGVDIDLTSNSTLTLSGALNNSDGDNNALRDYIDFDANGTVVQTVIRTEDELDESFNQSASASFRKTFDKEDQLFTIDAQWSQSGEEEWSDLYEYSPDNSAYLPITQRTYSDENQTQYFFQSDYVHPFGEEGVFETGTKAQLRDMRMNYLLEDLVDDDWQVNDLFNNQLRYVENIYAAYVMAGNKTGKFSYQAGLRAEYSDVTTELIRTDELNRRTYLNLFPSAHLSYELKENNFIQLSYSRRISRPRHWYLMPFFTFSDSRNITTGNPNLDPEFTHSLETGYLKQGEKGSLLSSIYYRYTTGLITRLRLSDSTGITSSFPVNLGTENSYGLEFAGNYIPNKAWTFSGNFNFFRAISDGEFEGVSYDAETYAFTSRVSARWRVKRKFSAQTSFMYRSPRITGQGKRLSLYSWDAGWSLDVLKGNGTLSFSARDLLNSRRRRGETEGDDFFTYSEFQWRARTFTLSFSYRINQKKQRGRGRGGDFDGGDFEGG